MSGTRIYIGRINFDVRERDIQNFFRGYGRIRDIVLKNGFGFVEFEECRDADDAVYELNGRELCGDRVLLDKARRPPKGSDALRVDRLNGRGGGGGGGGGGGSASGHGHGHGGGGGYPSSSSSSYRNRDSSSRIACFENRRDMSRALERLDGRELNGKRIKIVQASSSSTSRRSRSGSRDESRKAARGSRNRSRSRSPLQNQNHRHSKSSSKSPLNHRRSSS